MKQKCHRGQLHQPTSCSISRMLQALPGNSSVAAALQAVRNAAGATAAGAGEDDADTRAAALPYSALPPCEDEADASCIGKAKRFEWSSSSNTGICSCCIKVQGCERHSDRERSHRERLPLPKRSWTRTPRKTPRKAPAMRGCRAAQRLSPEASNTVVGYKPAKG